MLDSQVTAINKMMLDCIGGYCRLFAADRAVDDENDVGYLAMIAEDVAYNAAALNEFNDTKDAKQLRESLYMQDTIAREQFYDVIDYIDAL
mgnify:CR=1 FL=1